jgi:primosomal protein N' (replication factor Y)
MAHSPTILHVAICKPLRHCFDYLLPIDPAINLKALQPGIRLLVPFGKKQEVAVLLKIDQQSCIATTKLKPIIAILDQQSLFTPKVVELYQWASRYYQHPIGEVILGTLPILFRRIPKRVTQQKSFAKPPVIPETPLSLNDDQKKAVTAVNSVKDFAVFLLEGVTGSGKTEVYLQIIDHYLKQQKQALVLVPEIGLTPQTIARFEQRFAVPIAALHSKLPNSARKNAWLQAGTGEVKIVIGTRSAVFTPFANLGVIILDEEHDLSFKQQSGFRYSARDVAIMRGHLENVPVVLGTATPSLETLHNINTARFRHLLLPERAGNARPPSLHLIDLRKKPLSHGLSPELLVITREHLQQNNQVLLFLNRRGYASVLLCHACGWSAQCLRCDARLTLHHRPMRLICHHCTKEYAMIKNCGSCHATELFHLGLGTEQLEHGLREHFPETDIVRIDRDTIRHKDAMEKALERVQQGHRQILIGTQMLAKGHHFPNVTLVGVIDTDAGLFSTDFRATERMGQLILQVAGRAGRAEKPGQVFLQTHQPDHPLLQMLIHQGYAAFAKALLEERKAAFWPPFSFLALLRAETKTEKTALKFLTQAREIAENLAKKDIQILGPIPAPMERKAGHFRALLLFQAKQRPVLQQWLEKLVVRLEGLSSTAKVRWSLDVDPQDMG